MHASVAGSSERCLVGPAQLATQIRLKLSQYEGAVTDAIASLSDHATHCLRKLDAKAYFRASQASYALKNYDAAAEYCQNLLSLEEDHKDATQLLARTKARLREQSSGFYDIAAIQESGSRTTSRVDAADFLTNTTVKTSGLKRGRGLFATKDLKPGDLILAETAFASVWYDEKTHVLAAKWNARSPNQQGLIIGLIGLWKLVSQKVRNNSNSGRHLLDLHGDYNVLGKDIAGVDGVPIVDTYQVHDIVARNAFQIGGLQGRKSACSGVYIRSSYINHSCVSNSTRLTVGDLLLLHATKPIAKGEELSISYGDILDSYVSRKESMMSLWNFECNCALCLVEARLPNAVLTKRKDLTHDANAFMERSSSRNGTTESMMLQAEKFAREIAATYDNNLYSTLPRTALVDIQAWIVEAAVTCRDVERSRRSSPNLLRSLGYEVHVRNGNIERILPTTNSIVASSASNLLEPLIGQVVGHRMAGHTQTATHLTEFVKALDRMLHGSDADTIRALNDHLDPNAECMYRTRMATMASRMTSTSI